MNVRRLMWVFAAWGTFTVPALAEDLDCRWFIPAADQTVPVRCAQTRREKIPTLGALSSDVQVLVGHAASHIHYE